MNIVYISHLSNEISQGPNYSVPAQISAQSQFDNVFWWNLTDAKQDFWLEYGLFHGITEFPQKCLKGLPHPFCKPDLVVFESFYYIDDVRIARECNRRDIDYVIVPRSALTWQGQKQKQLKKKIANAIFFKKMTKHAKAIHYLTRQEYEDSGSSWNKNYFVIPNGIKSRELPVKKKKDSVIKGIYIGRFDPYQKGLDLLLDACAICKDVLEANNVVIELFGPERLGCREQFNKQVKLRELSNILFVREGIFDVEKYQKLESADFFVMTSRFEGMPMSMIEALSFGLPCLATKGTNMTEQIREFDAGWVCECDANDISSKLMKIVDDKALFWKLGSNAWKLSKEFNWEFIAKRTHEEYKKIIKQ